MNPERLQFKTLLAESKKKYRNLDTETSGLIVLIRYYLNPCEDILNLDIEKVAVLMEKLQEKTEEMKELKAKIKKLEQELD